MESQFSYNWKLWERQKQELLKFCMEDKWEKVIDMYNTYPILQYAQLTASEETALHIAVLKGTAETVKIIVESIEDLWRRCMIPRSLGLPNDQGNTPLHVAALIGNVSMCKCIAEKHEELLDVHNTAGETPLFLAAYHGKKDAFLYLFRISDPERHSVYCRRGKDGQTILHVAIVGEYFELAYQIICKYDELINAVDENGYTPLHLLATKPAVFRSGYRPEGFINRIIYPCLPVEKLKEECRPLYNFQPDDHTDIKKYPENYKTCINLFQPLLKMLQNMVKRPEKHPSDIEAEERAQFSPPNYQTSIMAIRSIWRAMLIILRLSGLIEIEKLQAKKEKNIWSVQIMDRMLSKLSLHYYGGSYSGCDPKLNDQDFPGSKEIEKIQAITEKNISVEVIDLMLHKSSNLNYASSSTSERHPWLMQGFPHRFELKVEVPKAEGGGESKMRETTAKGRESPILLAAKNGIIEMVERILEVFPMAALDRDSDGKNLVLLAVENRQTKLYARLLATIIFNHNAFGAVDNDGNSALHVAATLGNYQPYPFAALQMQWEIKWFKYVKQSVPRGFFVSRNNENKTPKEVFMESHKDLVKEGGKWLKETSNSCSLVAALITTVAFATTATVPGGMKEGSGRPNLERHPSFIVFAISSLVALAFSVTSTVSFLSILTSRYHQKDFRRDLPRKLLWALTSLFISLAAMLVCFCAAHFVLVKDEFEHSGYLVIYAIACLPIAYFSMMQFRFYFALIRQTFKDVPQRTPFG